MATTTKTNDKAQATQDGRVLALRNAGATWRFIAEEMGWGWHPINMDGGRAKRAYHRALKAEVDVTKVQLPKALLAKLAKAQAPKVPAPTPKAAPKARKPRVKIEEAPQVEVTEELDAAQSAA